MELIRERKLFELDRVDLEVINTLKILLRLNYDDSESYGKDTDLFYKYKNYDLDDIVSLVNKHSLEFNIKLYIKNIISDKNLLKIYLNILIMQGIVVLNDNLNGDDTYRYVPSYLQDSSYTKNYSNIYGDGVENILLVSDTHIGSIYKDYELINKVFEFALNKYNVSSCLHLGDVFEGIRLDKGKYKDYSINDKEVLDILYKQIDSFESNFPDYLKIIAIEGNHDLNIIKLLNQYYMFHNNLNEHYLSIIKPNFHLLKLREFGHPIELDNFKIHLNHELQFNMFFTYVKTFEIENDNELFSLLKKFNTNNVDLYLSGHFHFDFNHIIEDENNLTKRVFEVIPMLSKYNKNGCIAKILRLLYDNNKIIGYSIIPLYLENNKIREGKEKIFESNYQLIKKNIYTKSKS